MDIDQDSARVAFPPPLAFIGTLLAGLALDRFSWFSPGIPLGHWLERGCGWLLLVVGLAIGLTAIGLFRKAGTDVKPWKPTTGIVTEGVYRWTRNPMYLGMTLAYAGLALLFDSLIVLLLLIPLIAVIQNKVIAPEEAYLEGKFGEPYRAYKARVGRWFGGARV